ncbi:Protein of unknown function [Bacillus wiedmannii]|nr:Protein of unknown function [Bacillus wiedmannii]
MIKPIAIIVDAAVI